MRIAFYAPLKPPDHDVASGDRTVARGLIAALELAGHEVRLASRLRSYDGGDESRQDRLRQAGIRLAHRLLRRFRREAPPDLWFTYHLYHKAPDWLGPAVAGGLGIPYVVAEASYAPKQADGPWHIGHRAVAEALRQASLVVQLNPADAECVAPLLDTPERLMTLPPFLDTELFRVADRDKSRKALAARFGIPRSAPWLLTAAMMRADQKLASYQILAEALETLPDLPWRLIVAGGGPAEGQVRAAFDRLQPRVTWTGTLDPQTLRQAYRAADLFVWPAIKEAWGMALVEAQAAGLPVVAGRSGGVAAVVEVGVTGLLTPEGDAAAFAAAIRDLLSPEKNACTVSFSPLAGEGREGGRPRAGALASSSSARNQTDHLRPSPLPGPPPRGGRASRMSPLAAMSQAAERRAAREHDIATASRLLDARLRTLVGSPVR